MSVYEQKEQGGLDLGCVTHVCTCGSEWWNLQVSFDDYEIAAYLLEMTCVNCGNKALAPTLPDKPGWTSDDCC